MPQIKFHAVGAHEGKTITLDRFDFVEGVYTFTGSPQDAEIITKVLREQYSAVPESEFEEARKAFEDAQAEAALAEPETSPASLEMSIKQRVTARRFIDEGLDPDHVYGPGEASRVIKAHIAQLRLEDAEGDDVLSAEELTQLKARQEAEEQAKRAAEEQAAAEAAANAAAKAQAEQTQDNGGGEPQPEGAKIETVADAIQALDPANDKHWTARGVPSIEAMAELLGRQVTRAEVEEVAPDYTRTVAKTAKAAS